MLANNLITFDLLSKAAKSRRTKARPSWNSWFNHWSMSLTQPVIWRKKKERPLMIPYWKPWKSAVTASSKLSSDEWFDCLIEIWIVKCWNKRSPLDERDEVIFTHEDVHPEVILNGVSKFSFCVSSGQNSLLQDQVVNSHAFCILTHFPQHGENIGSEVVHRFTFIILKTHTLLCLIHQLQALVDVIHRNLVRETETSLHKKINTFAWQRRMRASKLRVVIYLSSFLRFPSCSWRFSMYLFISISWSSSLMVGL